MIRKFRFIFFFLTVFSPLFCMGQTDSTQIDLFNIKLLKEYEEKIKIIEKQRAEDSIIKADLEIQLSKLKTTENFKKERLQKSLQEIVEKEEKRILDKKSKIDSLRLSAKSFPVYGFFNDTLFLIYSHFGSFSAKERSKAIHSRIKKLKNVLNISQNNLILAENESSVDLIFEEQTILSISENDAIWNNKSKIELAKSYQKIIIESVKKYQKETSYTTLLRDSSFALGVLLCLFVLIFLVHSFYRWLKYKIIKNTGKKMKGLTLKNYQLLDENRLIGFLITILSFIRYLIIFFLIYLALPIIFGFFPWTKNYAQVLFGYITEPFKNIMFGIWNYLPNFFTILVIFFVFRILLKILSFFKTEIANEKLTIQGFYPDWANPTFQMLRVLLYAFMFVMIFPFLPGSNSPVFQGVSVFLGFLFTFGSAGSLSNIVAGIILTYMRLFKVGDRVKIGEVEGDVVEKSILVTRIKSIKNQIISIPNSTIMNSHTINYSLEAEKGEGLILYTSVTIGYTVPWEKMHQALIQAAKNTNLILDSPEPFVLQTKLDDFYVAYQINAYTKFPNKQELIYSELHQNIQNICKEQGIEIMSPHYRSFRDGNASTIPID